MADRNQRHVVPDKTGHWKVVAPHAKHSSGNFGTQDEAIGRAREILSHTGGGELVIHRPDGSIRESDTVARGMKR